MDKTQPSAYKAASRQLHLLEVDIVIENALLHLPHAIILKFPIVVLHRRPVAAHNSDSCNMAIFIVPLSDRIDLRCLVDSNSL